MKYKKAESNILRVLLSAFFAFGICFGLFACSLLLWAFCLQLVAYGL
jgi:hypothetical protein